MKMKKVVFLMMAMLLTGLLAGCQKEAVSVPIPPVNVTAEESESISDSLPDEAIAETAQLSTLAVDVTRETAPAFAPTDEVIYVTGSLVNLRTESSTNSQVLKQLNQGTELKRIGFSDQWSQVVYEGTQGYISSAYVSTTKPKPVETPVVSSAVNGTLFGNDTGKIIAIDAGHQAKGMSEKEPNGPGSSVMKAKVTSGATGVSTGLTEYKLNLAVSLKLKEELLARGYQVFMVRETNDVVLSNVERAIMANESGADIFIRVHANSLNDSSVRGTLTMCMTKNNPYYPQLYGKSSTLSKLVTDGICNTTAFRNRGVQETDTMTGINWCTIPTTIVEMGFMSNAQEDELMATNEYQIKIAKGIADGIDAYYSQGN